MSHLLSNTDDFLIVNTRLCRVIGLNNAIVFQRIFNWCEFNRRNCSKLHFKEGFYWTFNSISKWASEDFDGILGVNAIRKSLNFLVDSGLLIVGNFNVKKFDKTKWYRVNFDRVKELEIDLDSDVEVDESVEDTAFSSFDEINKSNCVFHQTDLLKSSNRIDEINQPIPKNNITKNNNNNNNNISINQSSSSIDVSSSSNYLDGKMGKDRFFFNNSYDFFDFVDRNLRSTPPPIEYLEAFDSVLNVIYSVGRLADMDIVRIGGVDMFALQVKKRYMSLGQNDVFSVIDNLRSSCDVRNKQAYIRTALYNAVETTDVFNSDIDVGVSS